MSDNASGSIENSVDGNLRVYRVAARCEDGAGRRGRRINADTTSDIARRQEVSDCFGP